MNTPYIKTGSFRRVLLQALADGAINTIDDLQTRLDEPRKKIQDNIMHAAEAGLIKRLRDDVTGLPAYQISREGRDYLALAEKSVEKVQSSVPQQIESQEAIVEPLIQEPRVESQGLEAAYSAVLAAPSILEEPQIANTALSASQDRFLIVSQAGRLLNFEDIHFLVDARKAALDAAKNEGMNFEVYRVELMGFAFPPSAATWQDA